MAPRVIPCPNKRKNYANAHTINIDNPRCLVRAMATNEDLMKARHAYDLVFAARWRSRHVHLVANRRRATATRRYLAPKGKQLQLFSVLEARDGRDAAAVRRARPG